MFMEAFATGRNFCQDSKEQLQDEIDAQNLWDLDAQVDVSMEALRCPPDDANVANRTVPFSQYDSKNPEDLWRALVALENETGTSAPGEHLFLLLAAQGLETPVLLIPMSALSQAAIRPGTGPYRCSSRAFRHWCAALRPHPQSSRRPPPMQEE